VRVILILAIDHDAAEAWLLLLAPWSLTSGKWYVENEIITTSSGRLYAESSFMVLAPFELQDTDRARWWTRDPGIALSGL
jgi:hypothetical protein